MQIVKVKP
jgi:hypothetical protein